MDEAHGPALRVWVDADACPAAVRDILCRAAERRGFALLLVANQALRVPRSRFVRAIQVASGFDEADARWAHYPVTTGAEGQPAGIAYNNKWTESVGDNTDNTPVIRYAEVLLIRADAYAEAGQEDLARADLNQLRASRGVGPVDAAGPQLIGAILDERRRELAFEGHRWFDLKRRGMDIPKPVHSGLNPLPYTDYRVLAPLPSTQVQNNPELVQNPGY
jgi:starch-binding outer membrane protein, SusD/RagB family